jgi:hypothetical protein
MKKRYNLVTLLSFIGIMGIFFEIKSCMITFVNDHRHNILLYDLNDQNNKNHPLTQTFSDVSKGKQHRFGSAHEHAHFAIYIKNPKHKSVDLAFEVKQNTCGKNGNPIVKFSDLKNKTGETDLFAITENKHHLASMVHSLPMLQRPDINKVDGDPECLMCNK